MPLTYKCQIFFLHISFPATLAKIFKDVLGTIFLPILDGIFQILGAFWYLFAVERYDACWHKACVESGKCEVNFLYCGNQHMKGYGAWQNISKTVIGMMCSLNDDNPPFNYGIYTQALSSDIIASESFFTKYCYCLWWGLQNLR